MWASPGASPRTAQYDPKRPEMPWTHDGFRVVRRRAPANDHGIGVLRVGTTLASIHEDLALMDRWAIGAAGAVLSFAPLCGYWLAGRAARTVGDITDTASRMRPAHLNERLPLSGAGDELDQLAETINGMLDRIASHLERRRDFLANAAHELRTPLAAIRSSIEVALGQERSPEAYRDLLADVLDEAGSLETLVNQLLLISESEADVRQSDLQPTPLHELVAKAVDMFRGVAESRDIQLIIQRRDETMVPGRRAHLRQVVNNLLDNAIKYTPSGGRVTVALAADPEQRMARLSISDNGPGIDASDQGAIFDRFFRTDRARSRDETRGAGLGLSICRSVVEAHQGAIRYQSTLGAGTTLGAIMPLADARARPITQPHREA